MMMHNTETQRRQEHRKLFDQMCISPYFLALYNANDDNSEEAWKHSMANFFFFCCIVIFTPDRNETSCIVKEDLEFLIILLLHCRFTGHHLTIS